MKRYKRRNKRGVSPLFFEAIIKKAFMIQANFGTIEKEVNGYIRNRKRYECMIAGEIMDLYQDLANRLEEPCFSDFLFTRNDVLRIKNPLLVFNS